MRHKYVVSLATVGFAVLFAGALPLAQAESDPENIIKYRKNVMKSNGAHMAAAGAIIQGKVNEFKGQLADHTRALQAINKDVTVLFPKGSDFGDTEALDAVWQKWAEFQKRAKDAQQKSDAFAKTVLAGDTQGYAGKFKELSDSCKACHKDFRKEESK